MNLKKARKWGIVALLVLTTHITRATHYMGGEITYQYLGANQYKIILNVYRDCDGSSLGTGQTLNYESASLGMSGTISMTRTSYREVSPLCPSDIGQSSCNGGSLPGVEQHIYEGTVFLPAAAPDWIISDEFINRNYAITNLMSPGSQAMYIETLINNSTPGIINDSPTFSNLPVPFICQNESFNYNHGAVDGDGDSLVYSMINPIGDNGFPIAYSGGLSVGNPLATTGAFNFSTTDGSMEFTPTGMQVAVITVKVDEYRGGVLIGSIMRDVQIVTLTCLNDAPVLKNGGFSNFNGQGVMNSPTEIQTCVGAQLNFDIIFEDADATDSLKINSNLALSIPDADTIVSGINPATLNVDWIPTTGGLYSFTVQIQDNACPTPSTQVYTFNIMVYEDDFANAGLNQVVCADSAQLDADPLTTADGLWTVLSGSASFVPNDTTWDAEVKGLSPGENVLIWTVTNTQCPNYIDTVVVYSTLDPKFADAGIDTNVCDDTIALGGAYPFAGTGVWSVLSGGVVVDDGLDPESMVTNVNYGDSKLIWTVSIPGCPDSYDTVTVTREVEPSTSIAGIAQSICGDSSNLSGNVPAVGSGQWSIVSSTGTIDDPLDENTKVTNMPLGSNIFRWSITNGPACPPSTSNVDVFVNPEHTPEISITPDANPACAGMGVTFTTTLVDEGPGPVITWYIDDILQTDSGATFGPVVLTNNQEVKANLNSNEACLTTNDVKDSVVIQVLASPTPMVISDDTTICETSFVTFLANSSGGALTWIDSASGNPVGSGGNFTTNAGGVYYVEEDNGGCPPVRSNSVVLTSYEQPIVDAGPDLEVIATEGVRMQSYISAGNATWSPTIFLDDPFAHNPVYNPDLSVSGWVTYNVDVVNGPCYGTDEVRILVHHPVLVPNAFSPNGDGANDHWEMIGIETYPDAILEVFNRWGAVVYRQYGNINPWNGRINGRDAAIGTYFYVLNFGYGNRSSSGSVTIMR